MKALKHSPEWGGPIKNFKNKDGTDLVIMPYSRRTSLQIHTRGYTKTGQFVEGHWGNGDETLFVDLGWRALPDANGQAKIIHDNFMVAPKIENEILL